MGFKGIFAASFALVILLAVLTVGFAYNELKSETQADFWVAHSHQVIEQNQLVLTLIQRAESSERAYLISGDPQYLSVYAVAQGRLRAQAELARLVSDSPSEAARVGILNRAVSWRAAQFQRSVELARGGDVAGAKAAALVSAAGGPGAGIRQTSEAVTAAERRLLEERVRQAGGVSDVSLGIGLALAAVALLALLTFVFYLARANQRLVRAMAETERANAERARVEQRLREAQRMEAIGQLTGGVAHDFNNLLQVILGNLELLEPAVADNPDNRRRLTSAVHGAERAAQLTRQLLAFARRQPLSAQVISLSNLIGEMTEILRRTLGEGVEVSTLVAPDLWNTLADPAQVESAILNLAINARDAMPEGGHLTIEAGNTCLELADLETAGGISPGDFVRLAVTDTGEGMTPETRERAFEPFFTTKGDGKGSGLGLSMVYGFVRQSKGHIRLDSASGNGTTVTLYLPRSRDITPREAPAATDPHSAGGAAILVVEDDANVRFTVLTILGTLGYRCLEASDAAGAVALVEAGAKVDLVFTDVSMPGPMKTRDMADRLRELIPGVPILFTSGYPREEIGRDGLFDAGFDVLAKPYPREVLAAKVAQLLADAGDAGRV